jgi:hypothetical protein
MANLSPTELAAALRKNIFTEYIKNLSAPAYAKEPCLGVVMEMGYEKVVPTVFGLLDGSASIYFSTGGGIIGGQGHKAVRIAARRFTQFAGLHLPEMSACTDFPLPKFGETTFYVLTWGGVFTLSALEEELRNDTHEFSPLYLAGLNLIAQLQKIKQRVPQ